MAKIKMNYINKSLLGSKGCKPTVGFVLFLMILGCSGDNEYYIANKDKVRERPGQWVHFLVTEYENGIYKDTLHKTKIVPERSALVLIDVWRDEFLDQFVIDHINPLIEEFNTNGAKVIYAPSQMPENENLMVVDEGIHFYDFETMDSYLHENSILNLFYAGFDTFYCVLDKPNGVYNFKMRNKYSRTFLLERGVLSYTKEMMEASMELLKKNGVGVIPYSNGVKSFPQETITDINAKTKSSAPNSKENSFFIFYPSNDELESSILDNFKLELDNLEVKYGVVEEGTLIVEEQEIAPENFIKFLRDNKVWSLFYAGAHLNNEIIWSEYGVLPMYIKSRYQLVRGIPQPYVINDLVFMAQSPSMDKDLEKATILNHYRMIYNITSTTLLDSWQ